MLEKEFKFEAAHQLPQHDGKCARLHGHSWKGRIAVTGGSLVPAGPKAGMVIDYGDLKALVDPIVRNHLDHWFLNETTGLANPTSEELARWIFDQLAIPVAVLGATLHYVQIEETCTSRCTYFGALNTVRHDPRQHDLPFDPAADAFPGLRPGEEGQ